MVMKAHYLKLMAKWHAGKRGYYEQLMDCCLDSMIKAKLHRKIIYHSTKLRELI